MKGHNWMVAMMQRKLPTTRWHMREANPEIQELLVRELGIHPLVSKMMFNRNIFDPADGRRYLSPSLSDLHNPFLMRDMKKAVDRLIAAIHQHEKIVIYGDYDADGITSVATLFHFLRQIHPQSNYYIPDRIEEGYGLHQKALDRFRSEGVTLIVTVDCGISDHDQIAYAKKWGMDTIILDHHEISETIPDADAIVNPHRSDCHFPFKDLAAVGIVFNFLIALRGTLRKEGFWKGGNGPNLRQYLDLVALGTIGDIVPLVDENRIFVKFGLDLMTEDRRVGISALKRVAGIERQVVDSFRASFNLIPRINAAGRIATATDAVQLLLSENNDHADELSSKLDGFNRKRQAMERAIFCELLERIGEKEDSRGMGPMVFASPDWHPGVIGIVASKLVDRYGRPVILISLKDGIGKGSGRSVEDINIYQELKRCEAFLLSYGGHRYAAGIAIRENDIEPFSTLLSAVIGQKTAAEEFSARTTIDAQCNLTDITHELLCEIAHLAPFGSLNPEPVLCVRNVRVASPTIVGNNHLRMRVSNEGVSRNTIWFSQGQFITDLSAAILDIVFTPQINHWNGSADIQLKMRDVAIQTNA